MIASTSSCTPDFARWTYSLVRATAPLAATLADPLTRATWLSERCRALLDVITGLAQARRVEVITETAGDDAFVTDLGAEAPDALLRFLARTPDTTELVLRLDLSCVDVAGAAFAIPNGAIVALHVELDAGGQLDLRRASPIWMWFELDTDMYAPSAAAPRRDHRALAELNGPRLTAFLQRLEREMPAELLEIETRGDAGAAHRHGFGRAPTESGG